jgi:hypothetical protein
LHSGFHRNWRDVISGSRFATRFIIRHKGISFDPPVNTFGSKMI